MSVMLAVLVMLIAAGSAFAGPLDTPGATKALTCAACHGPAGQSPCNTMPILAGISTEYFKKAIEDYATGGTVRTKTPPSGIAWSWRANSTVCGPAFHACSTVSLAGASPSTCSHWNSTPGDTMSRSYWR